MVVEQGEVEIMELDVIEYYQDMQLLDVQLQVNFVDVKYQELWVEFYEVWKNILLKNFVDDDKLFVVLCGEFVDGISDLNDLKWVKGIQICDCVYQNQLEMEKISLDMN